jgi:uncharacterized protein YgiB involved in biofilm formation
MKRSATIRLTLMSAAAATTLTGCGETPPAAPPAFKAHLDRAPRFTNREECESKVDVDHCVQAPVRAPDGSTTNVFVPLMAGYLLGRMMTPPPQQGSSSGGYVGGGGYRGTPIYRSRDYPDSFRDGGNLQTSRQGGSSVSTAPSRPANINTTTVSRSGFGSSGSSFGGGSS